MMIVLTVYPRQQSMRRYDNFPAGELSCSTLQPLTENLKLFIAAGFQLGTEYLYPTCK